MPFSIWTSIQNIALKVVASYFQGIFTTGLRSFKRKHKPVTNHPSRWRL